MQKLSNRLNATGLMVCLVFLLGSVLGCGGATPPKTSSIASNTATVTTSTASLSSTAANPTGATMSLIASSSSVKAGDSFDLVLTVSTTQPTRGTQFTISWNPAKVECVATEQGEYFKSFAQENGGDIFVLPNENPAIDNTNGQFPQTVKTTGMVMMAMSGAPGPDGTFLGPTGTGSIWILRMVAKNGASGIAEFKLANVKLGDNSVDTNDMKPTIQNGQITIMP